MRTMKVGDVVVPTNPRACDYADYPARLRDSPRLLQRAGVEVPQAAALNEMFTVPAPPDLVGSVQSTMGQGREALVWWEGWMQINVNVQDIAHAPRRRKLGFLWRQSYRPAITGEWRIARWGIAAGAGGPLAAALVTYVVPGFAGVVVGALAGAAATGVIVTAWPIARRLYRDWK